MIWSAKDDGVVSDEGNLYPELTGFDNLCFCAALYGLGKAMGSVQYVVRLLVRPRHILRRLVRCQPLERQTQMDALIGNAHSIPPLHARPSVKHSVFCGACHGMIRQEL